MPTATPGTLVDVLLEIVRSTGEQASKQPDAFRDLVSGATDKIRHLKDEELAALKKLVDPPDWWSLLVFAMVRLEALDDHLKAGVLDPGAPWCKAVTLSYQGTDPLVPAVTLALSLVSTEPGRTDKGIIVWVNDVASMEQGDSLKLKLSASGVGEWRFPFQGAAPSIVPTTTNGTIEASIEWNALPERVGEDFANVSVGALTLNATLFEKTKSPWWSLSVGLGNKGGRRGVVAEINAADALGPVIGSMLNATVPKFTPRASLQEGREPEFTLGAES